MCICVGVCGMCMGELVLLVLDSRLNLLQANISYWNFAFHCNKNVNSG